VGGLWSEALSELSAGANSVGYLVRVLNGALARVSDPLAALVVQDRAKRLQRA
jgi:hypothetical protein